MEMGALYVEMEKEKMMCVCVCVKWEVTCERGILYVDKKKFRAHLKMG